MITSIDAILYTMIFLVPGFITVSMLYIFSNDPPSKPTENFLKYLVFSCINGLISFVVLNIFDRSFIYDGSNYRIDTSNLTQLVFWAILCLLAFPLVFGYLLIWVRYLFDKLRSYKLFQNFLTRINLWPKNRNISALDYCFDIFKEDTFAKIIHKDGTIFTIQMTCDDFLSESGTAGDDLYFGRIHSIENAGENNKDVHRDDLKRVGLLIKKSDIQKMYFYRMGENSNVKEQTTTDTPDQKDA